MFPRLTPTGLLVAAAAALVSTPRGQVVVDPNGGGHFTSLQAAIDAVPEHTVLRVVGGTYGPLEISKSLTIVGDPAPTLTSPPTGPGPSLPSAITLQGTGSERLVLSRVLVTGTIDGIIYGSARAAIGGAGFAALDVYDSTIEAPTWFRLTGVGIGTSAIDLPGASVLIARSTVRGASSEEDRAGVLFLPDGVAGVSADTVVVLDSTVVGGGAGLTQFTFGPPQATPCPCPAYSGRGGPGITAQRVFDAGSVVLGGTGSQVEFSLGFTGPYWPWGAQPNGPAFHAAQRVQLPSTVFAFAPPEVGTTYTLGYSPPLPLAGGLAVGVLAAQPQPLFGSWFFLDLATLYGSVPVVPGLLSSHLAIPAMPSLVGAHLSFQLVLLDGTLSNPVGAVIVF